MMVIERHVGTHHDLNAERVPTPAVVHVPLYERRTHETENGADQ